MCWVLRRFLGAVKAPSAAALALVCYAVVMPATLSQAATGGGYVPSQPKYDEILDNNQYVTMSDGTQIRADVARPNAAGQFPVIVWFDVYYKDDPTGPVVNAERDYFVSRGYVFVNAASPGSNSSCGTYDNAFSAEEQEAAYSVVEWSAVQPWSDGKVGMDGLSYAAIIQFFAAGRRPPHLVTIYPTSDYNDMYRDLIYTGGLLQAAYPVEWDVQSHDTTYAPPLDYTQNGDTTVYCYATNKVGAHPIVADYLQHPYADGFYDERSPKEWTAKIDVPVAMDEGLYDDMLYGGLTNYAQLTTGTDRLILGPWTHTGADRRPDGRSQRLRWFDYFLKGLPSGVTTDPRVQIYVPTNGEDGAKAGQGNWFFMSQWPATSYQTLYLGGNGTLEGSPGQDGSASYTYLPNYTQVETSTVTDGESVGFESSPATAPTDLVGYPEVDLYAATSTGQDTAFNVALYDVDPSGGKHLLQQGELRAAARETDPSRSVPGRPYYYFRQDLPVPANQRIYYPIAIWPIADRLDTGHRLLVVVSDSPNGHNGDPFIEPSYPGTNTVSFGQDNPSKLLLPVVDLSKAMVGPVDPNGDYQGATPEPACVPLFTGQPGQATIVGRETGKIDEGQNPQLDIYQGNMHVSSDGLLLRTVLNIQNLAPPPQGFNADEYYMQWSYAGKSYYAEAAYDGSAWTFSAGTVSGSTYTPFSDLTHIAGIVQPGPDGTIEVDVPLSEIGGPSVGDTLTAIQGHTVADAAGGQERITADSVPPVNDFTLGETCSITGQPGSNGGDVAAPAPGLPEAPAVPLIATIGAALTVGVAFSRRRMKRTARPYQRH